MPHKIQPELAVRIIQLEIVVPADAGEDDLRVEISTLLTENGICREQSLILDWQFTGQERDVLTAGRAGRG